MRGKLATVAVLASLPVCLVARAANVTYGWEDGATVLKSSSTLICSNAAAPDPIHAGAHSLKLVKTVTAMQEAYVAWIRGLQAGDQVTASFWVYDTTLQTGSNPVSPAGRIWAHYTDSDTSMSDAGSAGGNNTYSPGTGWSELSYTWAVPAGKTGLVIKIRVYGTAQATLELDDLAVTAPDREGVSIQIPGVHITGSGQAVVTTVGAADTTIALAGTGDAPGIALTWTLKPDVVDWDTGAMAGLVPVWPTESQNSCTIIDPASGANLTNITSATSLAGNGNQVRFHAGDSGLYQFTYYVESPTSRSPDYRVVIGVQSGRVIITEIMHRPNNYEMVDGSPDHSKWGWVEIKNVSGQDASLDSLLTPETLNSPNLVPTFIHPGEMKVLLASGVKTKFRTEWNGAYRPPAPVPQIVDANIVVFPEGGTGAAKPVFNNEDTLFLCDYSGELLDAVTYRNGADGWPVYRVGASFFLEDGKFNGVDNDNGANWKVSRPQANNAYQTLDAWGNGYNDSDRGSPMLLPGGPTVVPPDAPNEYLVLTADGASHAIALTATPDVDATVTGCTILTLPQAESPTSSVGTIGLLADPDPQGGTISAAPYTLKNGKAVVNFTPARSGVFTFTYQAADNRGAMSAIATVVLYVQTIDQVYITEIMNNPRNAPAGDWKWIEIYNPTASAVNLGSLTDNYDQFTGNLPAGTSVGAGEAMILVPDVTAGRTRDDFLAEWTRPSPYAGPPLPDPTHPNVVWVPEDQFPSLSGSGTSSARLYKDTGELLDTVGYKVDSPWPRAVTGSSIFLKPTKLGSVLNDDGANWMISAADEFLAYATPDTPGGSNDSDAGSPAAIALGYPIAEDLTVTTVVGHTPIDIVLSDDNPAGLTYVLAFFQPIMPTSTFGGILLLDPHTAASLTGGGTLSAGAAGTVRLHLDGTTSGAFRFTYHVLNGSLASNEATVSVYVQKGSIIVTEIMYDPANDDAQWEWAELTNLTASPVMLGTVQDSNQDLAHIGNLDRNAGKMTVPADGTIIFAKGDPATGNIAGGRTGAQFLAAWAPLTDAQVIWVPSNQWPGLNNTGGSVLVFEPGGELLDIVQFQVGVNGWPASAAANGAESIYLTGEHFTASANDSAAGWALSMAGQDQAYVSATTSADVGSPGVVVIRSPADLDGDGDVDTADLDVLIGCAMGPDVPVATECRKASLDGDEDVDADDFGIFQRCLSGAGHFAHPTCVN